MKDFGGMVSFTSKNNNYEEAIKIVERLAPASYFFWASAEPAMASEARLAMARVRVFSFMFTVSFNDKCRR
jgi:hypothetical protein